MPTYPISRKKKDLKGLESIKGGGAYMVRSRNKVKNPNNPNQTLSRGSVVTVKPKTETKTSPTTYKSVSIDVPKQKFVPGDFQTGVKDRPTTMALGKQLKEAPAKTEARMNAQAKSQPSYIGRNGQSEYSGRFEKSFDKKEIKVPVPGKSEAITRNVTTVKAPPPKGSLSGRGGTTKRGHVEWLDRKSENKAFTAKPNTGGKTKIKWTGAKVKRY